MKHISKILLVLVVIAGIAFPFAGVVNASNGLVDDLNPEEPVPDGQGGGPTPTPIRVRMNGTVKAYYTSIAPSI